MRKVWKQIPSDSKQIVCGLLFLSSVFLGIAPLYALVADIAWDHVSYPEIIFEKTSQIFCSPPAIVLCDKKNGIICYDGIMEAGGVDKLRSLIIENHAIVKEVKFHSGGGSTNAKKKIADLINSNNLKIMLRHMDNSDCGSACAMLIAAVNKDLWDIKGNVEIMFHVTRRGWECKFGPGIDILTAILEYAGDSQLVEHIENALNSRAVMIDDERQEQSKAAALLGRDHHVVNAILDCLPNPFLSLGGITLPWSEIEAIGEGKRPETCPSPAMDSRARAGKEKLSFVESAPPS